MRPLARTAQAAGEAGDRGQEIGDRGHVKIGNRGQGTGNRLQRTARRIGDRSGFGSRECGTTDRTPKTGVTGNRGQEGKPIAPAEAHPDLLNSIPLVKHYGVVVSRLARVDRNG